MTRLIDAFAKQVERDPFFGWLMVVTVAGSLTGVTYLICCAIRPEAFQ